MLLVLLPALAGCSTSGEGQDSDGEGLSDQLERVERSITVTRADGVVTLRVASSPDAQDTDGDGFDDLREYAFKTDPRDPDTDRDGLLDGHNRTVDAEGDVARAWRSAGIVESPRGTFVGELDVCQHLGGLSPTKYSSDRPLPDGLADGDELRGWNVTVRGVTTAAEPDPCNPDADHDGALDDVERALGSDPRRSDTDGDGVVDAVDVDPLWDLRVGIREIVASGDGGPVDVVFTLGLHSANATLRPGRGALVLDAPDAAADRATHPLDVLVVAEHPETREPVRLFPGGSVVVLTFDVATGHTSIDGRPLPPGPVVLAGSDGGIRFEWTVVRE